MTLNNRNKRVASLLLLVMFILPPGPAAARELKIVFTQYTPPYVLEEGNGIVVDIMQAALEPSGYQVVPVYVPYGRAFELLAEKRVDGSAIIREKSGFDAHYSDVFMQYHNRIFGLKSRNLQIRSFQDIKNQSILGFQNARLFLGEEFGRAVAENPGYKEIANQETQTLMLLLGRIDLAVMDESIFRFYREKLISEGKVPASVEIETFPLFAPTPYQSAFVDAQVRDDFNKGLAEIRRNGTYDAIYRQYIAHYFPIRP